MKEGKNYQECWKKFIMSEQARKRSSAWSWKLPHINNPHFRKLRESIVRSSDINVKMGLREKETVKTVHRLHNHRWRQ
jgi:hypothetical protein